MDTDPGPGRSVDVRGIALAVSAVVAAVATLFVTPGSGTGPATLAVLGWLAMLWLAAWATFIDDRATVRYWLGAAAFAVVGVVGFIATIESVWGLAFPGLAVMLALRRRRSSARFVAAAAWAVAVVYVLIGATS